MSQLGKDAMTSDAWRLLALFGKMSDGREGADDDEARRDRREPRESQGEGGVTHVQHDQQTQGGQKEMYVPMEVYHVLGIEPEEDDWEVVNEVRRR